MEAAKKLGRLVVSLTCVEGSEMERVADRLNRFSFKRQDTGKGYDLGLFPKPIPMEVPHP